MRRRTLLSGFALSLCGCAGSPSATETATTATSTTDTCSTVQTDFDVPDVKKPDPLTAASAEDVVRSIEQAYVDYVGVSPEAIAEIPDDVDSFTFSVSRTKTEEVADGYRVEAIAMARYGYDGEEQNQTEYHADRPMSAGTYRVTPGRAERVRTSVVGDLTGTLVCW